MALPKGDLILYRFFRNEGKVTQISYGREEEGERVVREEAALLLTK